ncbi:MAG: 30S ribosomal protein S6 [Syntrophobacterales bacterium]|nr:30S ribosomal protein S6 [Syntrophobacterales bacterium]
MQQRKYEVFFLVDPDLGDSELQSLETRLRDVIGREGGTLVSYNSWGKKKLAYPVKKRTRGHYFLLEFFGGPNVPHELERNLKIDERVLKFITVKLEERERAKPKSIKSPSSKQQEQVESEKSEE